MSTKLLPNQLPSALIQVRAAWGADLTADSSLWTWTDVTTDVLQDRNNGISLTMGKPNEFSTAPPAGCTFRLKNPTGAYTPNNPASTNYPNVRRNTPLQVRVSLDGGSNWSIRFFGYANGFTPGWDADGKFAFVTVSASGITRRLSQGNKPLRSALTRSILGTTAAPLYQYWPCEDGVNATQAASGFTGGTPMATGGVVVRFAAMDLINQTDFILSPGAFFGFAPQPSLKDGGSLTATFSPGSASAWTIQSTIFCNPITDDLTVVLFQWTDATGRLWQVTSDGISADSVSLKVNGSTIASQPNIMISEDVRVDAAQSGGNINWSFKPMLTHAAITGSFAGTLGGVNSFTANPNNTVTTGSLSVGQIRVWDTNSAPDFKIATLATSGWSGYNGETATDRLTRLCAESGIPFTLVGTSTTIMGGQGIDTFMNLLRECEAVDLGCLLDGLGPGLSYIARSSLYNQTAQVTIDANSGQVPVNPPPQPLDDDQGIRNRITVTRKNGSSVTVEDEDGPLGTANIGVYDDERTVNTETDDQLLQIGNWLLHLGTVTATLTDLQQLARHESGHATAAWAQGVEVGGMSWRVGDGQLAPYGVLFGVTLSRPSAFPMVDAVVSWAGSIAGGHRIQEHDESTLRRLGIRYVAHRGPGSAHQAAVDLVAEHGSKVDALAAAFLEVALSGNGTLDPAAIVALLG